MADILIVEDDEALRETMAEMLADEGHAVRTARNGLEGLRALDARFPQTVISDVEMPDLSGPAMIYRMFIENLGRENIPVILISAHPGIADIARAAGTPYRLSKPFQFQALLDLLTRVLAERHFPRPTAAPSAQPAG
jgi:DNA-binding NtrC family response regulator